MCRKEISPQKAMCLNAGEMKCFFFFFKSNDLKVPLHINTEFKICVIGLILNVLGIVLLFELKFLLIRYN